MSRECRCGPPRGSVMRFYAETHPNTHTHTDIHLDPARHLHEWQHTFVVVMLMNRGVPNTGADHAKRREAPTH